MQQLLRHLLLLLILFGPGFASSQPFPSKPIPTAYFTNFSSSLVLSQAEADSLDQAFEAFSQQTGIEFLAVVVDSLAGMSPRFYANELANQWQLGVERADQALLLLCAIQDRKAFLATGKGVQKQLTDAEASQLLIQYLVPHFRAEAFPEGMLALIEPVRQQVSATPAGASDRRLFIGVILGLAFLILKVLEYVKLLKIPKVDPRIDQVKLVFLLILTAVFSYLIWQATTSTVFFSMIGGFFCAFLINIWVVRLLILIWDRMRPFPTYTAEELNIHTAHAYLLYILMKKGAVTLNRVREKAFIELLFAQVLEVAFDEAKYSPVKGKKMGTDTYVASKGKYFDSYPFDFLLQRFQAKNYPIPVKDLMRTLMGPEELFTVGERLVGSGMLTYRSWKRGNWQLTEAGEELSREIATNVSRIQELLNQEDLDVEQMMEQLQGEERVLLAMPLFEKRVVPDLLAILQSKNSSKPFVSTYDAEWEAQWWFWYYFNQAFETHHVLWELHETLVESREIFLSSGRSPSLSSSQGADFFDSSSYSEGSFDGGGGGADW